MKHTLIALCFLLPLTLLAQTTYILQKKTGGATTEVEVAPENNKAFGINGSGNVAMLPVGGSSTLAGLSDVAIAALANLDVLQYDTNTSKWVNTSQETLLGAPVIALGQLADGAGALTNDGAGVLSWVGYQEADATLAALAALDGTTGFLKQTGADTFTRSGVAATDIVVNPFEVAGKALVSTGGGSGAAAFGNVSLAYTTGNLDGSSRVTFGANEIDGGGNAGRILKRTHQNGTPSVGWGFLHPEDISASGTALQYLRRNAGNTALEWATPTVGTPGGSGTELQYRAGASTLGAVAGSSTANGGITLAPTSGSALTLTGGTITASAPLISGTQTWNAGAVAFHADDINVTNTASAATSTLLRRRVGGVDRFKVSSGGDLTLGDGADATISLVGGVTVNIIAGTSGLAIDQNVSLANRSFVTNADPGIARFVARNYAGTVTHFAFYDDGGAANTLQLGADHATTASNQRIKGHDVTTGTGAAMDIAGGKGSVAGGSVTLSTSTTNGEPTAKVEAKANGSVAVGAQAALATNATDGFIYVPTCAGTPTGAPTAITGLVPMVVDTTNNKLYFYSGGAWRDAGP